MTRIFCLSLIGALACCLPFYAQQQDQKDPPAEFTNSVGMKFVWIRPGSFLMGSPKEEKEKEANEIEHKVTLTKGFYMSVHTVTQEQWQEVMDKNPSAFTGPKTLPVEQVSWDDCQEFIKKLKETDKKPYRLPTEAEWEYACRAGTTTKYNFGDEMAKDKANYTGNPSFGKEGAGILRQRTAPVGTFPANAWGLHDMHGNVRQWCQDWYGEYPPNDVVDPQGPNKGTRRILRGGSWAFYPHFLRSAYRASDLPVSRKSDLGVRLCCFAD